MKDLLAWVRAKSFTVSLICLTSLAACDGGTDDRAPQPGSVTAWSIGPVIDGKNYSVGMPKHPKACPPALFCIDFPGGPQAHAHYVTTPTGPLTGKTRIRMRYRVEMADDVKFVPKSSANHQSILTLYFQRRNVDWDGYGEAEYDRWYAAFAWHLPIKAGEHEIVAPLDGNWTAVFTASRETKPHQFAAALANAGRVGFVLGGGDGLGHGVYTTGPARIAVTEFVVE
jgi:hypothetical protein